MPPSPRSGPRRSSATSTTSSPSRRSPSARSSHTCGSRRSPSATSCTAGSAAAIRSAIRAYGIPVPTTTGRSTPTSSGSRPTRAPYATSPRQRPHRQGDHPRSHHARDRQPDRVRRARGRLPGQSPRHPQGTELGADVHSGERAQRAEQLRVRQLHVRTGRLGADREEADSACDRGLVLRVRPQVRHRLLPRPGFLPPIPTRHGSTPVRVACVGRP